MMLLANAQAQLSSHSSLAMWQAATNLYFGPVKVI